MKVITFGLTLFATLLFALPSAHAQSIKKKGWIVLNNGDTLHGWFNYRNWERNPSSIGFSKDSLAGDISKYSKYDLQSVNINGLDYYQKAIVKKDTRPVKLPDLLPGDINPLVTDTVLLRVLVQGSPYTLFELMDEKVHFFIKAGDGEIQELTYKVVSLENNDLTQQKTYIRQLKTLLHNTTLPGELLKKIDAANYKERDLSRIVKQMNNISGSVQYMAPATAKKILTSFFAGAGGGFTTLRFSGVHNTFGKMKYKGGVTPFATVGVDIATARNLQAIVFRGELSFSTASYKGESKQNSESPTSYEVSQANISPSFSLLYHFIRKESLRIYIGGGASYNISFYSKNRFTRTYPASGAKHTDNYLDYPGGWLSISGKLGVKLSQKLEVGVNGHLTGSFTNYTMWGFTPNTYTAQVRYFFK